MKKITEQTHQTYPARVIQFGEGNFMRGFFNWQLQQMNKQGLFNGSAVVVQPIDHGLKELLAQQENLYTVILEGLVDGALSQTFEVVSTIDQVLNPYQQWEDYLALAEDEQLEIIVSNTTEAGIAFHPEDTLHDTPPHSFPAKLTALLYRRFQRQKPGFLIIPCELIDRNGEKLKEIVLQYAALWSLESDFVNWLEKENTFCCSLVDRIVPGYPRDKVAQYQEILGYEDAVMVTAEPFMLWVIEGSGVAEKLPLQEAGMNVIVTEDMTPYREQKVHLLNGPHTAMVPLGLLAGLETVEEVMNDRDFAAFLDGLFQEELIPMLDLPKAQLTAYAEQIKERFRNPYVKHQLQSIALNSVSKFHARLQPVLSRYVQQNQQVPKRITAALAGLLTFYLTRPFQDDELVTTIFQQVKQLPAEEQIAALLKNEQLWHADLSFMTETINEMCACLKRDGPRQLLASIDSPGPSLK